MRTANREDCLCGSGRPKDECCLLSDGRYWKRPPTIDPPGPQTNYSHNNCYLRSTKNCSTSISAEHYISKHVLEAMPGPGISLHGLPWLKPGEIRTVGINAITAKILCTRHNSALHELDLEAGSFFRKLRDITFDFARQTLSRKRHRYLFSGTAIELWMVKVAGGILYSRIAAKDGERLVETHSINHLAIVRALSRGVLMPRAGLYMRSEVGTKTEAVDHIQVAPLSVDAERRAIGVMISLLGYKFEALFDTKDVAIPGPQELSLRPSEIVFENGKRSHTVLMSWPIGTPHTKIVLTVSPNRKQ